MRLQPSALVALASFTGAGGAAALVVPGGGAVGRARSFGFGKPLLATVSADDVAVLPFTESTSSTTASADALPTEETATPSPPSPGLDENSKFECDDSVAFWRDFQSDGFWPAGRNLREIGSVGARFGRLGREGARHWLRHAGRSGYFAANAVLGNVAFAAQERLVGGRKDASLSDGAAFSFGSTAELADVASRLALEACLCYEQDYERIRRGEYREPWDMAPGHRQSSLPNLLTQTGRFVEEAVGTLARRKMGGQKDRDIWITDEASPSLYPDYYRTAFHYQSDGWMSKRSADVYETSTETLFLGRQDAMQRTSMPPLVAQAERLAGQRPMKVLEVAAGTGRFMTFVRDSLPLDAEYTAIDLSPYYLDAARSNDEYWRKTRRERERQSGGRVGRDDIKPARLVQAQAESLPFGDESFDAILCVYLYHELPREVRARASAEMARVLKQDGVLVVTDSIQRGDRPATDDRLARFENFNEPYFVDYLEDDLPGHFERHGLRPMTKTVRSTTKSLSFLKPTCEVGERKNED